MIKLGRLINRTHTIELSIREVGVAFADSSTHDQADAIDTIAATFESWGAHKRDLQILGLAERLKAQSGRGVEWIRDLVKALDEVGA